MLLMQATTAVIAVIGSRPVASSSIVIAMIVAAVHQHEGEHGEDHVVLDHLVAELHRHHGARVDDARHLADACLKSTTARTILMPPPVEPELVAKHDRKIIQIGREHRPLREIDRGEARSSRRWKRR